MLQPEFSSRPWDWSRTKMWRFFKSAGLRKGQPLSAPAGSPALLHRPGQSSSPKACPTVFLPAWETFQTAFRFPTSA